MKKCQQCAKPATLHITEIIEGEGSALHLCENCAQDYLGAVNAGDLPSPDTWDDDEDDELSMDDELEAALSEVEEDLTPEDIEETDGHECPNCGITFKEFRKIGRLGCPQCYLVFAEELDPLLENIHGETEHIGKYPKRAPESSEREFRLIRLQKDLQDAVDAEDYERAAQLRDEIGEIKASSEQTA